MQSNQSESKGNSPQTETEFKSCRVSGRAHRYSNDAPKLCFWWTIVEIWDSYRVSTTANLQSLLHRYTAAVDIPRARGRTEPDPTRTLTLKLYRTQTRTLNLSTWSITNQNRTLPFLVNRSRTLYFPHQLKKASYKIKM